VTVFALDSSSSSERSFTFQEYPCHFPLLVSLRISVLMILAVVRDTSAVVRDRPEKFRPE